MKQSERPVPAASHAVPDEATLLRLLVEAARDFAIFALDPDGTILTWNPGVRAITGYDEHEFIGMDCAAIFTPEDRAGHIPVTERETARRDGQALDERWHVKKDGSRFWGSGSMHALYDDTGSLKGFAKILQDRTKEKQHEDRLEELVKERTARYKKLQQRLLDAQEDERLRISRELHDQTAQYLAALGLELGAMEQAAAAVREAAATAAAAGDGNADADRLAQAAMAAADATAPRLARLRVLTDALSQDIHRLAVDLRPTALDDLGLVAALQAFAAEWAERTGTRVEMECVGLDDTDGEERRLPAEVVTALYRITQEALTNAAKYAVPGGATAVGVALQRSDGYVLVTIEDDGPGFDVGEAAGRGRLGLAGMRERAELLDGTLEVESGPGRGTTIYARIPIPTPEPPENP
jgi:PAS domain S-box-containing protein